MDGPVATRAIRLAGYVGSIFGITGNVMETQVAEFKKSGADEVFAKPIDVVLFNRTLNLLRTGNSVAI